MIIGVPREIKEQEYRVALLPSGAYQLIRHGHTVLVERGAGAGAGYPDAEYEHAGARLVDSHAAVFEQADLVVKVKEPLPDEFARLLPGKILFTYLHLAASRPLTNAAQMPSPDSGSTSAAASPARKVALVMALAAAFSRAKATEVALTSTPATRSKRGAAARANNPLPQ